jgi:hypothetical protein
MITAAEARAITESSRVRFDDSIAERSLDYIRNRIKTAAKDGQNKVYLVFSIPGKPLSCVECKWIISKLKQDGFTVHIDADAIGYDDVSISW